MAGPRRIKIGHQHFLRGGGGAHKVKTRLTQRYLCRKSKSQKTRDRDEQ
ncbi:MAG: hypothetical protein HPY50_00190 [Firmicutes bacterium]|nr:hypothetical protein [Bacillota bacterium]